MMYNIVIVYINNYTSINAVIGTFAYMPPIAALVGTLYI